MSISREMHHLGTRWRTHILALHLTARNSSWLQWYVHPFESDTENIVHAIADWIDYWERTQGHKAFSDISTTRSSSVYARNWFLLPTMELRGLIVDAARLRWPPFFQKPADFLKMDYRGTPQAVKSPIRLIFRRVSHTRLRTKIICDTTDVHLKNFDRGRNGGHVRLRRVP